MLKENVITSIYIFCASEQTQEKKSVSPAGHYATRNTIHKNYFGLPYPSKCPNIWRDREKAEG